MPLVFSKSQRGNCSNVPKIFPFFFGERNFVDGVFHRHAVHHLHYQHTQSAALVAVGAVARLERRVEVGENFFVFAGARRIFAYDDFAVESGYRFFAFEV